MTNIGKMSNFRKMSKFRKMFNFHNMTNFQKITNVRNLTNFGAQYSIANTTCVDSQCNGHLWATSSIELFSWSELKDIFRKCGKVTYTDAHQRIGSGRGEVCFDTADDLKTALKEMNGFDINGKKIEVFKTHVSNFS